jgi:uncharacterized protein YcfJ
MVDPPGSPAFYRSPAARPGPEGTGVIQRAALVGEYTSAVLSRESALRYRFLLPVLLAWAVSWPALSQTTVLQRENVRYEYAKVLRVSPVYQTLTASRMEQRCDADAGADKRDSRLSRVVGRVREAIGSDGKPVAPARRNCRMVQVDREFRRPFAYDVDYTFRGSKYRSRLAEDPGHLLRIRISVTPAP